MLSLIHILYETVLKAQLAALAAIGPGKSCKEVDAAARDLITQAGYGRCFGHATGHSVGLEIHEEPIKGDVDIVEKVENRFQPLLCPLINVHGYWFLPVSYTHLDVYKRQVRIYRPK